MEYLMEYNFETVRICFGAIRQVSGIAVAMAASVSMSDDAIRHSVYSEWYFNRKNNII